jgi:hypothetical protein
MNILSSEVRRKIYVPVSRTVRNNLTRLGKRVRRTVSTSPDRRLIWRKNGIEGLIDKGDFHICTRVDFAQTSRLKATTATQNMCLRAQPVGSSKLSLSVALFGHSRLREIWSKQRALRGRGVCVTLCQDFQDFDRHELVALGRHVAAVR